MSRTRANSTISRRELSSSLFLQGKAPKEIHAILTETLACFLPGRAKDLSAPLYKRSIPVAKRSETCVSGRSLAGTAGLYPAGSMDVCLL